MRFTLQFTIILTIFITSFYTTTTAQWVSESIIPGDYPDARYGSTGAVVGNYAYYGLGFASLGTNWTTYDDFWKYDPVGKTWTKLPDMPGTSRYDALSFVIGSDLYVGGGCNDFSGYTDFSNYVSDFHKFNTVTETWSSIAEFPFDIAEAGTFVINGKAYVVCGQSDGDGPISDEHNRVYCYDPIANTWTRKNDFPGAPRKYMVSFVANGNGYIGGGQKDEWWNSNPEFFSDFWEYNATTDTWLNKGTINNGLAVPKLVSKVTSLSNCDKGFIIGGLDNSVENSLNNLVITCYDPISNTWTRLPDIPDRQHKAVGWIFNESLYVGGGLNQNLYSLKPKISGPGTVCYSGEFTLEHSFANAPVTWQVTPSNLFTTSSGTGKTAVLTTSSFSTGTGTITFTQTTCTGTLTASKTFSLLPMNPGQIGADQLICYNTSPQPFTEITPASGSGMIEYTWEKTFGPSFNIIPGARNSTYAVPSNLTESVSYRRIATSSVGSCPSNVVTVSVQNYPSVIAGPSKTICSGDNSNFVLTSNKPNATFTWTVLSKSATISGVTQGATGTTTNTISHTLVNSSSAIEGQVVYRFAASVNGCTGNYEDKTVWITANVNPGQVAGNQTVCPGSDPVAFTQTVASQGQGTLNLQWKSSFDNISYSNVSSGSTTTYNPPVGITQTTYFKRTASYNFGGLTCSATTITPVIVAVTPVTGGQVSGDQLICSGGDPATFIQQLPSGGLGSLTYKWQKSLNYSTGYTDISGATATTYNPPGPLNQTTYYKRITTSPTCNQTAESNVITVSIDQSTPTVSPSSTTLCQGQPINISLVTTATGTNYVWKRDGVIVASGPNLSSYNAIQTGSYTVTITNGTCVKTSAAALVTQSAGVGDIRQFGDLCADGYVDLRASVGSNYSWSTAQTSQTIRVYSPGTYSVTYVSSSGCTESASTLVELIENPGPCNLARQASPNKKPVAKPEDDISMIFSIHPNPTSNVLNIVLPSAVKHITPMVIYDHLGHVVYESSFHTGEKTKTIFTDSFVDGIYMLQIVNPSGSKLTRKVIVKH